MTDELLLKRLLETTQDVFIFHALESGLSISTIKALLNVNTDRVTRISKIVRRGSRRKSTRS